MEQEEYENKCDKLNSHISSKLQMNYISSNNDRHPLAKTFTSLHFTSRHFFPFETSPTYTSLHFTTLVDTSLFPI